MDPYSLADKLLEEMKNITVTIRNGKEIYTYKGIYCIAGKEELFIQVSNTLKTLNPMEPLEYSSDLILDPENPNIKKIIKGLTDQEKSAIHKQKEADYKERLKSLKEKLSRKYQKIEALTHTTNENYEDSIIMQILSNFNIEKNPKAKRPFDIIFGEQFKYVGLSMTGNKKLTGNIIFAY